MFEMPDAYFVSVILFFAILGVVIYRDRKNVEFHTVVFMRRTERFRKLLDRIANISPRFWKAAATLGVFGAFYVMFYGSYLLLNVSSGIITGLIKQPALQLILPTPAATGSVGPGYMLIPFWFWIVTIGAILVPHEMMHGIVARAEKIRLRSVGLMLMIIFPGAFVEPDEKQLQKAKLWTRLRVFAAGSFANFSLALIILALFAYIIWPLAAGTGVMIETVTAGGPAAMAGLQVGQLITHADGNPVASTYWEFTGGHGYLYDEVGALSAGDTVTFESGGKSYEMVAAKNPETGNPYIGITYKPVMKVPVNLFFTVANLFSMIWVFSLAVGMVNVLPIYPLDGGLMFEAVVKKYIKDKRAQVITRVVTYFLIIVLLFDFVGPWLIGLL